MTYTKRVIAKNIVDNTSLSNQKAKQLLDSFIKVIISASRKQQVKISGFGTFIIKETPERVGRNPKTSQEFKILKRNKLKLILSNKIKEKIN
jgi:integration host factor subunit alpha